MDTIWIVSEYAGWECGDTHVVEIFESESTAKEWLEWYWDFYKISEARKSDFEIEPMIVISGINHYLALNKIG